MPPSPRPSSRGGESEKYGAAPFRSAGGGKHARLRLSQIEFCRGKTAPHLCQSALRRCDGGPHLCQIVLRRRDGAPHLCQTVLRRDGPHLYQIALRRWDGAPRLSRLLPARSRFAAGMAALTSAKSCFAAGIGGPLLPNRASPLGWRPSPLPNRASPWDGALRLSQTALHLLRAVPSPPRLPEPRCTARAALHGADRPAAARRPADAGRLPSLAHSPSRSLRSFAQYSSRFLISRSKPRSGGS